MRLVTRSDFDGLACGTILCRRGIVDDFLFVHPKNIQDGEVDITSQDVLTNVPFDSRAGLWFDHHSSEISRVDTNGNFVGMCDPSALSCARLVYNYYGGEEKYPDLAEMINYVDKVDSAHLTIDEVMNPSGWVLIGLLSDPRTGLGRWHSFEISNRDLMKRLMQDLCIHGDINVVLADPHVQARVDVYNEQQRLFDEMIKKHATFEGGVLTIDLRGVSVVYTGNRFKPYALFPESKVSVTLMDGKGNKGSVVAIGKSIFNDFDFDIGQLCLGYGGGGHKFVGTCQFKDDNDAHIYDIINTLQQAVKEGC